MGASRGLDEPLMRHNVALRLAGLALVRVRTRYCSLSRHDCGDSLDHSVSVFSLSMRIGRVSHAATIHYATVSFSPLGQSVSYGSGCRRCGRWHLRRRHGWADHGSKDAEYWLST